MTRVVEFADGFSSADEPVVSGTSVDYEIDNNISTFTNLGFSFDESNETSAIIEIEIERIDDSDTYRANGSMTAYYDGSDWGLTFGLFSGNNMLSDSDVSSDLKTAIQITNVGVMQYKTGNMTGGNYEGKVKVSITRFSA